ncbi:MAG TPA: FAD-dependent oxidoreductase [Solirubrobacter sp.]|nr:FAD-dependent oxidoreductase [Solirubrobacter sp.]
MPGGYGPRASRSTVATSGSASDVVVVGAGSAGLAAAVAAAQAGARRVLVLEKAAVAGGNARFSHTGFRAAYDGPEEIRAFVGDVDGLELPGYPVAAYEAELARFGVEEALGARLAADSAAALRWMRALGIPFVLNRSLLVDGRRVFEPGLVLAADGLVDAWLRIAAAHGVELRLECAVQDVVPGRGVILDGELVPGRAVVVAAGGHQASLDGVVRGVPEDTGEVLFALLARGAARAGAWGEAVITPVDASSPRFEGGNAMNRYSYPYGITVDRDGGRFFDEGAGGLAETYGTVGRAILARPGGIAYQLFDAEGETLLKHYAYRDAAPARAGSVRELARAAGLDPEALERTVAAYNAACPRAGFDPARPDGCATRGLDPPKSNWARPLAVPPFSAYAVTGGITFTLGGVAVDDRARVLDDRGAPLPGVFATGDAIGLFRGGYPSGAGQTRNVVFARLATSTVPGRA